MGSKRLVDLDYADVLKILYDSLSKMNELLEVLRVQEARKSKDENVTLGCKKIDQVNSFIYLGTIINKDRGFSGDFKNRRVRAQGVFFKIKNSFGRIGR